MGEQLAERLGTAGDEPHRRLDAGKGDGHGQDHRAESPEVVPGNGQQGLAAVGGRRVEPAALRAHHGHRQIDDPHQPAAQAAGRHRVDGHRARLGDAEAPDDLHHHDAERQARQSVHRVVSLEEAAHKGRLGKRALGGGGVQRAHGPDQGRHHQHRQADQKQRVEHLAHPGQDLARPQGKPQHRPKKHQRKQGQRPLAPAAAQRRGHAHLKGDGGAPGDGEKGPDGQVEQAGKEQAVVFAHPAGEGGQAVAPADAQRRHPQQGQAHACDQQPRRSRQDPAARQLAHRGGKDQVARPEKQPEQHTAHRQQFPEREFRFHTKHLPSCITFYS